MGRLRALGPHLPPLFAVLTLPLGVFASVLLGPEAAMAVFVVGWFLLVPLAAIVFGPPSTLSLLDELEAASDTETTGDEGGSEPTTDPVETLRDRYARGEVDEAEFERRLEALLETGGLDPDDEAAIERAVERLDSGDRDRTDSEDGESGVREADPERE